MATTAEKRARLEAINNLLEAGVVSTTVAGEWAAFDHDTLRDERAKLQRELGQKKARPLAFNVNMGGR